MDNSHTPLLDKKLIDELKTLFSKKIIEALKEKKIPFNDLQNMASSVSDVLSGVANKEQFLVFLEEVLVLYPYLNNEVKILKNEVQIGKEKQVINKLSEYIKNFSQT